MKETARELFERMRPDLEHCAWPGDEEPDAFQARYRDAILEVGAVPILAELFLHFEDSMLTRCLNCLNFVWNPLPFSSWKEVLHLVAWSAPAVYQLVWSASDLLGVDMVRVILDDPEVDEVARECATTTFGGAPPRLYSVTGVPLTPYIKPLWRRLATEGAPMIYDIESS